MDVVRCGGPGCGCGGPARCVHMHTGMLPAIHHMNSLETNVNKFLSYPGVLLMENF